MENKGRGLTTKDTKDTKNLLRWSSGSREATAEQVPHHSAHQGSPSGFGMAGQKGGSVLPTFILVEQSDCEGEVSFGRRCAHDGRSENHFLVFLRVLCGYSFFSCGYFFFFLAVDPVSGCAPVTLARTLSKASLAVISLLRLLLPRYLCSLLQVRQRVCNTSSPIMETTEWSVVRLQREQWSSISSPSRMGWSSAAVIRVFCRKAGLLSRWFILNLYHASSTARQIYHL